MRLHVITASACERAIKCPGSLDMPRLDVPSGPGAIRGTRGHEHISNMLTTWEPVTRGERWPQSINIPAIRAEIGSGNVPLWIEQAMSWNCLTDEAYFYSEVAGRIYPDPVEGICYGTADLVVKRADGVFDLYDWKTIGRSIEETATRIGDPHDNWQWRMLALMVARHLSAEEVHPKCGYIHKNGDVEIHDGKPLFEIDFDATASAIKKASVDTYLSGGDHCFYCHPVECKEKK